MFPSGWPGIALLLLRVSVAASAVHTGAFGTQHGTWILLLVCALSVGLCTGFLTPIVALLSIPVQVLLFTSLGLGPGGMTFPILDALALAMLGPGAYSVDAYWFGRRMIVWPTRPIDDADSD